MPRNARRQDPFARIKNWDDGFEYIRDRPPSPPAARDPPPFSPPPGAARPAPYPHSPYESDRRKPARGMDEEDRYARRAYPSPPDSDGYPRRKQRSGRSPSPPRRSRRDDPPLPTRHRPRRTSLDSRSTGPGAVPIGRSKSMRDGPRSGRGYSRSPSPPPRRYRRRSPSPILPGGKLHRNRDWEQDWDRERPRDFSPARRRRSPSPPPRNYNYDRDRDRDRPYPRNPPAYPDPSTIRREKDKAKPKEKGGDTGKRPNLSRSKTTTAAARDRFANLSPRWQQAAAAAFQAGSLAALNMRSQPGAWNGEKGARVATAALGAGVLNAFNDDKSADKGGKKKGAGGSRRNSGVEAIGGALGGFLADQFASHGSKGKRRY